MNFIFAKLYEEYLRQEDSPNRRITMYISIVYFFQTFVIALPIKAYINKQIFKNQIHYEKWTIMVAVFAVLIIITYFVHLIYIKKGLLERIVIKHKRKKIKKSILYLIVALTPVTLMLFAGTITVYLTGGEIFGQKIHGLLE